MDDTYRPTTNQNRSGLLSSKSIGGENFYSNILQINFDHFALLSVEQTGDRFRQGTASISEGEIRITLVGTCSGSSLSWLELTFLRTNFEVKNIAQHPRYRSRRRKLRGDKTKVMETRNTTTTPYDTTNPEKSDQNQWRGCCAKEKVHGSMRKYHFGQNGQWPNDSNCATCGVALSIGHVEH